MIILTQKEQAAEWKPIGTLYEAMGCHRALSLFSSTACCGTCSSLSNSTFPGLGFESLSRQFHVSRSGVRIPVMAIFSLFFRLPTFCNGQSMYNIFLNNFFDWLIWVVIGVISQKNCLDWDSNPRPGKRGIWLLKGIQSYGIKSVAMILFVLSWWAKWIITRGISFIKWNGRILMGFDGLMMWFCLMVCFAVRHVRRLCNLRQIHAMVYPLQHSRIMPMQHLYNYWNGAGIFTVHW